MNFKLLFFAARLSLAALSTSDVQAQSGVQSDPGISTHNYKHPNKAAAAAMQRRDGLSIQVYNPGNVKQYNRFQQGIKDASTPRYAARPASFIVFTKSPRQKLSINPLISSRNYKTGNHPAARNAQDELLSDAL